MLKSVKLLCFYLLIGITPGCSSVLTPELIHELAGDPASFCAHVDLHGGMGGGAFMPAPVVPMAGYGSSTLSFCRSNHEGATVTMGADGAISIEHR